MFKNNLKIPKWQSESVNRRVTHNKIGQKDKQLSTKHYTEKTNDRATRTH